MTAPNERFSIAYPADYDARREYEALSRGDLTGVIVRTDGGSRYSLTFSDPVRIQKNLIALAKGGKACLAEVNMVVLHEVTTGSVRRGMSELVEDGHFQHLKPL